MSGLLQSISLESTGQVIIRLLGPDVKKHLQENGTEALIQTLDCSKGF